MIFTVKSVSYRHLFQQKSTLSVSGGRRMQRTVLYMWFPVSNKYNVVWLHQIILVGLYLSLYKYDVGFIRTVFSLFRYVAQLHRTASIPAQLKY